MSGGWQVGRLPQVRNRGLLLPAVDPGFIREVVRGFNLVSRPGMLVPALQLSPVAKKAFAGFVYGNGAPARGV